MLLFSIKHVNENKKSVNSMQKWRHKVSVIVITSYHNEVHSAIHLQDTTRRYDTWLWRHTRYIGILKWTAPEYCDGERPEIVQ